MAKLTVSRRPNYGDELPETKEQLEEAAVSSLLDCAEFFSGNNIRFGPEGLYMDVYGRVYLFRVDVNLVREITEAGYDLPTFQREG